jgi:translation initiation factor 2 beta subunit (eIF-2beta)/eIF-5
MKREAQAVLDIHAHHRALRRCHGCGSYARPLPATDGRLLCEKCADKARRESEVLENLNDAIEI